MSPWDLSTPYESLEGEGQEKETFLMSTGKRLMFGKYQGMESALKKIRSG